MCLKNHVCKICSEPDSSGVVRELVKNSSDSHSIYTVKDKPY